MAPEKCEIDDQFTGTKCNVDKKILVLWMLPVVVLILAAMALLVVFYFNYPEAKPFGFSSFFEFFLLVILALAALGALAFIWSLLRYRALTHTITKSEIIITEGVINKSRTVIQFSQIQNIHIKKPLVYRLLGLSRVEIETAGTTGGIAEGILPGIANAEELVHQLLETVRKIKKIPGPRADDRDILFGILEELKALRERNENLAHNPPMSSNLEKELLKALEKRQKE